MEGRATDTGLLSMVGTPIGNLSDASPRVIGTLQNADLLLCEDTRVTSKLLAHFGIHVPLMRCDENVVRQCLDEVLERLGRGERVAFVSDAGMPGVSDPGQTLVDAALDEGLHVEVVPGPSAVTCALVASGLPMAHFYFEGFLPRKAGAQRQRLELLARIPAAVVIYESPRRAAATLAGIAAVMPQRRVALVRELTKVHEEIVRDLAPQLARTIAERDELRGECVIVIEGPSDEELEQRETPEERPSLEDAIAQGLAGGEGKSALAKRLAKEYGEPRSAVYDLILDQASNH